MARVFITGFADGLRRAATQTLLNLEVTRLHVHELRVDQPPAAAQPGVLPAVQT